MSQTDVNIKITGSGECDSWALPTPGRGRRDVQGKTSLGGYLVTLHIAAALQLHPRSVPSGSLTSTQRIATNTHGAHYLHCSKHWPCIGLSSPQMLQGDLGFIINLTPQVQKLRDIETLNNLLENLRLVSNKVKV